ncbi:MAG: FAD-dependent oxidoreductase, partial [Verrucomicrobiota bacterium]
RSKIPQVGKVLTRWSGQILETMDGLALIGADQPSNGKVYLISGDSGMGLTHGTLGGLLIADLLSQTPNPWAKLYDPHRFRWRAFLPYLRENLNTLWQYRNWFKTEESAMHRLQQGDGVIVQEGLHKVAQVRDENGEEQKLCAVCPHLGGLVQWNQGEKTWDCQCHGSRFSEKGEVINGPAREPLKAMV